jgi:hypothetical protein
MVKNISLGSTSYLNEEISSGLSEINNKFVIYICDATIIILYIEMVACIILNSISVFCILFAKTLSPIPMLILNLAVVDCLYVSIIPFYVRQFEQVKGETIVQTKFGCQISYFLDVTCMIVSIMFIVFL